MKSKLKKQNISKKLFKEKKGSGFNESEDDCWERNQFFGQLVVEFLVENVNIWCLTFLEHNVLNIEKNITTRKKGKGLRNFVPSSYQKVKPPLLLQDLKLDLEKIDQIFLQTAEERLFLFGSCDFF